jgi:hypothetical protein
LKQELKTEITEKEGEAFKRGIAEGTIRSKLTEIGTLKALIVELRGMLDTTKDDNHGK